MKKIVKDALVLFAITLVAGILLGHLILLQRLTRMPRKRLTKQFLQKQTALRQ